ncbi:MAG: hypothetical protein PHC70_04340 [Patescibacteria group bacterium]|nr:hypothetical protein [Patescibacteria group bacterium]
MNNTIDITALKAKIASAKQFNLRYGLERYNEARISNVLEGLDIESRIKLAAEMLQVWIEGTNEQFTDVFGSDMLRWRKTDKVSITLTIYGNQLRVWDFPRPRESFRNDHVDSCGQGFIFEVKGDPELLQKCLAAFLDATNLKEKLGINGARIFGARYDEVI